MFAQQTHTLPLIDAMCVMARKPEHSPIRHLVLDIVGDAMELLCDTLGDRVGDVAGKLIWDLGTEFADCVGVLRGFASFMEQLPEGSAWKGMRASGRGVWRWVLWLLRVSAGLFCSYL